VPPVLLGVVESFEPPPQATAAKRRDRVATRLIMKGS
jgi:hypothetical protein